MWSLYIRRSVSSIGVRGFEWVDTTTNGAKYAIVFLVSPQQENQLSKLAELELKTVVDYASRSAIVKQVCDPFT